MAESLMYETVHIRASKYCLLCEQDFRRFRFHCLKGSYRSP